MKGLKDAECPLSGCTAGLCAQQGLLAVQPTECGSSGSASQFIIDHSLTGMKQSWVGWGGGGGGGTEVQLQRATDLVLACPLVLWEARAHLGSIRVGRGPQRGCSHPAEERCRSQVDPAPKKQDPSSEDLQGHFSQEPEEES